MKKAASLLVAAVLMLCLAVPAFATGGVTVFADKDQPQAGQNLTFTVTFTCPSYMNAFSYTLEYDATALTFVSASAESINSAENGKIYYVTSGNTRTVTETFTFRCAAAGNAAVTVTDILSADGDKEYEYPGVSYVVAVSRLTSGDVNDDGAVNASDLALLKLYLAGQGVQIHGEYSDINKNGSTDGTDLALLKLYLAGNQLP